ncbi:MAG: hypothetical protein R3C42_01525 [Parvularculaceae bacterium]
MKSFDDLFGPCTHGGARPCGNASPAFEPDKPSHEASHDRTIV